MIRILREMMAERERYRQQRLGLRIIKLYNGGAYWIAQKLQGDSWKYIPMTAALTEQECNKRLQAAKQ